MDDFQSDDLDPNSNESGQEVDTGDESQSNSNQGRGFFTETEEDRRKHQKAGQEGGETTARRYGDTGFYQQIGREGGKARAAKRKNKANKMATRKSINR